MNEIILIFIKKIKIKNKKIKLINNEGIRSTIFVIFDGFASLLQLRGEERETLLLLSTLQQL